MKLFHYHLWTPHLAEMEDFYTEIGFNVKLRLGKRDGKFASFNPPLTWEDFQPNPPLFRIIEMVSGSVNVTFGFGKTTKFDHLGFLVSQEEYNLICQNAKGQSLTVEEGERRTFVYTPFGFKIELQLREDAVPSIHGEEIKRMVLSIADPRIPPLFQELLGDVPSQLEFVQGEETKVGLIGLNPPRNVEKTDPCGVLLK